MVTFAQWTASTWGSVMASFSMLGPSGSGKTTCLRLIAGFEQLWRGDFNLRAQGQ
jgi:ABC-type Fe3+/spermidine/putrescine transport system ATPase subunit